MATKTCTCCRAALDLSHFGKKSRNPDGLQYECRSCTNAKNRAHRAANVDRYRERDRAREALQADRINARRRERRAKNAATLRPFWAKQVAARRASGYKFKRSPATKAAYQAARDAGKRLATPPWADLTRIAGFYMDARRLTESTGIEHHVDHIVPLRGDLVCGLHVESNLQVITAAENVRKRNSFAAE